MSAETRSTGVAGGESKGEGLVIAVLGPTGVGKTAVGIELARLLGTSIISCDSMQVYAGFPVLTNQPVGADNGAGLHQLVGFLDPSLTISAGEYAEMARPLVAQDAERRGKALLVGGSGLYMRAALAPLASPGPVDEERRMTLERRADEEGVEVLHAELARLDPPAAAAIDARNVRRVIRALESVLTGRAWSGRGDLWSPQYYRPTLVVGLTLERDVLARRIAARTRRMVEDGAVEEVQGFCGTSGRQNCAPGAAGIRSAIGYADIWRYLEGEQGLEETVALIEGATRKYARRQVTWLRKARDAVMMDVRDKDAQRLAKDILALAEKKISSKESQAG